MKIRQSKLDDITEKYNLQKNYQITLEKRLKLVFEKYSIITDDQLTERGKFQQGLRELELRKNAASKIQAYWRSYKLRQKIKSKKTSKKKWQQR